MVNKTKGLSDQWLPLSLIFPLCFFLLTNHWFFLNNASYLCRLQTLSYDSNDTRVIPLCVINSFPCQGAAGLAARLLRLVTAMMYFKFRPVGDRGGCCLVSVLLMGKRRRGKRARTPQESAQIRKGWKMKNIMWWKQQRGGGNGDLWTAALWAVERFLVSPESSVTLGLWAHMHTHCHMPANKLLHMHIEKKNPKVTNKKCFK